MSACLKTSYDILIKEKQFVGALRIAIKINNLEYMKKCFELCTDRYTIPHTT